MISTVLNCKNCNAPLEIEEGMKVCYCKYCGTPNLISDGTININLKGEQHIYDEAKLMQLQLEEQDRIRKEQERILFQKQLAEKIEIEEAAFARWKKLRTVGLLLGVVLLSITLSIGKTFEQKLEENSLFRSTYFLALALVVIGIPAFLALKRTIKTTDKYSPWERRIYCGVFYFAIIMYFGYGCFAMLF